MALGQHFDEFLASVNRNQIAINPSADGQFALPKVLSENDRALLAHGLVRAMGEPDRLTDYFHVPGYTLRQYDASGRSLKDAIRHALEQSGVLSNGQLRLGVLDSRLG